MSLEDFEFAEVQEGKLYELGRGIVIVSDVPAPAHLAQMAEIKWQLQVYHVAHREEIYILATGCECKILISGLESERHPDLCIYKTRLPEEQEDIWRTWVPEIVIEVVSPSSRERDYEEKREEYLRFGVKEYWIFDAEKNAMLVLQRSAGSWREIAIRPPKTYRTHLLPRLKFNCGAVFQAARGARR
jgi:Uma2 family endonuclease